MRRKRPIVAGIVIIVLVALVMFSITHVTVSALPQPGHFETSIATTVKNWCIRRAAHGRLPPAAADDADGLKAGSGLFGMECVSCHGKDGRTPTAIGQSMYPRVLDLGSPKVQSMSDRELFWVVTNGIRLSGMPGFARINSDKEIWQITYYVRSLRPRRTQ